MTDRMTNRRNSLIALLRINGYDTLAERVDGMTEEEFNNMNEAANGVLDLRVKEAEAFGKAVLRMLTAATGDSKSLLPGIALLQVAESVKGSLVMAGLPVEQENIDAHVINVEFMGCVISTLELSVPDPSGQRA